MQNLESLVDAAFREVVERAEAPADVVARSFFYRAIREFSGSRSIEDVRSELEFAAENLDDSEFPFMRP